MNYTEMIQQSRATGKAVARQAWLDDGDEYQALDELTTTVADTEATDWVIAPDENVELTLARVTEAWNAALVAGSPEINRAPNSARFKRFAQQLGFTV